MANVTVTVLAFLALSSAYVEGLTNGEFYDMLKSDIHSTEDYEASETVGDLLVLQGDANDEVNLEYLMEKLILNDLDIDNVLSGDGHLVGGGCSCRKNYCRCCGGKTFSVKIVFKRIRAKLSACVTLEYLRSNIGFRLTFVVNGRTLFKKEVSLKHPPAICYKVPGLGRFARVCLEIYNVDLSRKSMCTRLLGVVDLKVKKFKFKLKLACFRIPTSMSWLKAAVQGSELSLPEDDEVELSDVDGTTAAELTELLKFLGLGEINVDDLELTDTDV